MPLSLGKSSDFGRFKAKRGRRNRFVTLTSFNDEADKRYDFNMMRVFFGGSLCVLTIVSGFFALLPLAGATATTSSLLRSELTVNKSAYNWDEEVTVNFTLTNEQNYDVQFSVPVNCQFRLNVVKMGETEPLIQDCFESLDPPTGLVRGRKWQDTAIVNLTPLLDSGAGEYQIMVENNATSPNLTENLTQVFDAAPVTFMYSGGPVEENPLITSLTFDHATVKWHEPLNITITIKNTGESDKTLTFNTGCYFDVTIVGTEINNTQDRLCTEALETVPIPAGEVLQWTEALDISSMATSPEGQYKVNVVPNGIVDGQWIENPQIPVADKKFTLKGSIEFSVALDRERYLKTRTVIGTWFLKNNGDIPYVITLDHCEPQLTLYNADTGAVAHELDWNCGSTAYDIEILPGDTHSDKITIFPSLLQTLRPGRYVITFDLLGEFIADSPMFELYYSSFTDITGHWAQSYVRELQESDAVSGYERNRFRPDQPVTRAEFLKMAYLGLGVELEDDLLGNAFFDSKPGDWHYLYVENAYRSNLVRGYANNLFRPNQQITRAEAVTVLLTMKPLTDTQQSAAQIPFSDVKVNDWFGEAVSLAHETGIVNGYPNNQFRPNHPLTRAEAATLISKMRAL